VPDNNPLFKEIYIDANPDLVFSFLTERDKFPRWMGRTLEMEPRRGGLFRLDPNGKDLIRGEFLEVIRPRRVVFTWGFESGGLDVPPGSTVVEIDLVPQGEGTLLRLTHRALPADGEVRRGHGAGWDHHLSRLRAVAEGRDPGPDSCPQEGPGTLDAPSHPVVPHAQWIASRTAFLVKEKEFTRLRDELSRQRRELPWEHVEKAYAFDGPGGIETLGDLFAGNSQLIVHHFMFGPDWDAGCKSCSFWADCYDGIGIHLKHRDISFVTISRAPLALLEAYKRRMGWSFKWVSSLGNDFNFDFNASFTREEVERNRRLELPPSGSRLQRSNRR
jgi:uncharacterized protein YndB with AHSA1/START domain